MATSVYFNNFSAVASINQQRLLEDLVVESIKINGHDVFYLPREAWNGDDSIFGENTNAKFSKAYNIEMYLANVEGYEGDGDFFSKFGLEIRESSNFVVSRRSFEKFVPPEVAYRPREGDLIYVPVLQKMFEIKFVEEELLFFSLGNRNPYLYELRCEVFRYSNENIETGISEVDDMQTSGILSYTVQINVEGTSNNFIRNEVVYQGTSPTDYTASATVGTWDPNNKILLLNNIKGDFANGTIKGVSSNAIYTITGVDTIGDHIDYDLFDNKELQTEANDFIDFTERNPFGLP
jgi:hypothetical protein